MPSAPVAPTRPKQHGGKSNDERQAATISQLKIHSGKGTCAATSDEHNEDTTEQNTAQHTTKLAEASCLLMHSEQSESYKRQEYRGPKVGEVENGEMQVIGGHREVR